MERTRQKLFPFGSNWRSVPSSHGNVIRSIAAPFNQPWKRRVEIDLYILLLLLLFNLLQYYGRRDGNPARLTLGPIILRVYYIYMYYEVLPISFFASSDAFAFDEFLRFCFFFLRAVIFFCSLLFPGIASIFFLLSNPIRLGSVRIWCDYIFQASPILCCRRRYWRVPPVLYHRKLYYSKS